jgi:hypothetical protein
MTTFLKNITLQMLWVNLSCLPEMTYSKVHVLARLQERATVRWDLFAGPKQHLRECQLDTTNRST